MELDPNTKITLRDFNLWTVLKYLIVLASMVFNGLYVGGVFVSPAEAKRAEVECSNFLTCPEFKERLDDLVTIKDMKHEVELWQVKYESIQVTVDMLLRNDESFRKNQVSQMETLANLKKSWE